MALRCVIYGRSYCTAFHDHGGNVGLPLTDESSTAQRTGGEAVDGGDGVNGGRREVGQRVQLVEQGRQQYLGITSLRLYFGGELADDAEAARIGIIPRYRMAAGTAPDGVPLCDARCKGVGRRSADRALLADAPPSMR